MAEINDETKAKAKQVIYRMIVEGNLVPVHKLVQSGFPVHEPIMDCGINLVMHAASSQKCTGE